MRIRLAAKKIGRYFSLMFEHYKKPLLPRRAFTLRLLKCCALALLVTLVGLWIGILGYHFFEKLSWIDSFANAAMILSGMGPLGELKTDGGKIFAGLYALFSGLAIITVVATILAPILHRFFHQFHLEDKK